MTDTDFIGKALVVYNGDKTILVLGDLHLGYEGSLRASGYMIPANLYKEVIGDCEKIFDKVDADEIVLLGDIKHAFSKVLWEEREEISKFLDYLKGKCKKIIIVRGNHDVILPEMSGVEVKDFYVSGEFCFFHGDKEFKEIYDKKIKCWIIGHAHPAVTLSEGAKIEKYKCFLSGKFKDKRVIIVPSFLPITEGSDPRENDLGLAWDFNLMNFEVNVIGEDLEVYDFGKLKDL